MHGQNHSKATQGVCLVALILMHQVCASPIGSHDSRLSLQQGTKLLERRTRMTPLWRFMGTKPTGAYCRDHFECSTQICSFLFCCMMWSTGGGGAWVCPWASWRPCLAFRRTWPIWTVLWDRGSGLHGGRSRLWVVMSRHRDHPRADPGVNVGPSEETQPPVHCVNNPLGNVGVVVYVLCTCPMNQTPLHGERSQNNDEDPEEPMEINDEEEPMEIN
ncbi:uncharacterized protein ACWYII_015224 [Salvelinus alpinus]